MPTRVRSFSKINLGLAVGPVLPEPSPHAGYHGLTTCYQTLEAHDVVTVSARPAPATTITLAANHPGVPRTETGDAEKNTATRIVAEALEWLNLSAAVHIEIDKRLPVQGGLGAGSANAAAALLALERELQRAFGIAPLSWPERLSLAADIGSDVPLFFLGGTVLGLNRGEEVYPLPDLPATACVLAIPEVGVSTAQAFRELDAKMQGQGPSAEGQGAEGGAEVSARPSTLNPRPSLQNPAQVDKLKQLSHVLAGAFAGGYTEHGFSGITSPAAQGHQGDRAENPLLTLVRTGIENDFEEVAFSQHPSLRSTKRDLLGSGPEAAIYAALSGSGSALFGLYGSDSDALAAQRRVQASGTRAIVTKTLPRPGYWHTMFAE
jgi:4-diphosphocytidyl-2-C-methyl-D-erythritol kinase